MLANTFIRSLLLVATVTTTLATPSAQAVLSLGTLTSAELTEGLNDLVSTTVEVNRLLNPLDLHDFPDLAPHVSEYLERISSKLDATTTLLLAPGDRLKPRGREGVKLRKAVSEYVRWQQEVFNTLWHQRDMCHKDAESIHLSLTSLDKTITGLSDALGSRVPSERGFVRGGFSKISISLDATVLIYDAISKKPGSH